MTDLFHEIDEDLRRDRLARFWRRFGTAIMAAIVLAIAAFGGWRFMQYRQQQANEALGARLETALAAARAGDSETAQRELAALAAEPASGAALVARFRGAAETARSDSEGGADAFARIAADAAVEAPLRDLARLRAALLRMDTAEHDATVKELEPLAAPAAIYRHTAREFLGLSALKAGKLEEAGRWFDMIAADREAPRGLRQRVDLYQALVAAGPQPQS